MHAAVRFSKTAWKLHDTLAYPGAVPCLKPVRLSTPMVPKRCERLANTFCPIIELAVCIHGDMCHQVIVALKPGFYKILAFPQPHQTLLPGSCKSIPLMLTLRWNTISLEGCRAKGLLVMRPRAGLSKAVTGRRCYPTPDTARVERNMHLIIHIFQGESLTLQNPYWLEMVLRAYSLNLLAITDFSSCMATTKSCKILKSFGNLILLTDASRSSASVPSSTLLSQGQSLICDGLQKPR